MRKLPVLFLGIIFLFFCTIASADVQKVLSFQGRLTDNAGAIITGTRTFVFEFTNTGGASLGSVTKSASVDKGLYNVTIDGTVIDNMNFDQDVYVRVKVGTTASNAEYIGPRTMLTGSPYSMTVMNGAITPSKIAVKNLFDITVTSATTATNAAGLTGTPSISVNTISATGLITANSGVRIGAAGNSFTWDTGSGGRVTLNGSLNIGGTLSVNSFAPASLSIGTLTVTSTSSFAGIITATNGVQIGSNGTSAFTWDNPNSRVNLGTSLNINGTLTANTFSPASLSVTGTGSFGGLLTATNGVQIGSNGTSAFTWDNPNSRVNLGTSLNINGTLTANTFSPASLSVTGTGSFGGLLTATNGVQIGSNGTSAFTWDNPNSRVNLGTSLNINGTLTANTFSPASLSVTGTGSFGGLLTATNGVQIGSGGGTFSWSSVVGLDKALTVSDDVTANNFITAGSLTIGAIKISEVSSKLKVEGAVNIAGDLNVSGATTNNPADLAEIYASNDILEAGDVVIISESRDDYIEKSKAANDTKVAGVISTEPAIILNAKEKGYKLALVGKVPVKVTNEGGNIKRGDLLVASSTPGHAMKATDPKPGTIIGKALENLSGSKGKIMALVNLQ